VSNLPAHKSPMAQAWELRVAACARSHCSGRNHHGQSQRQRRTAGGSGADPILAATRTGIAVRTLKERPEASPALRNQLSTSRNFALETRPVDFRSSLNSHFRSLGAGVSEIKVAFTNYQSSS